MDTHQSLLHYNSDPVLFPLVFKYFEKGNDHLKRKHFSFVSLVWNSIRICLLSLKKSKTINIQPQRFNSSDLS